MNIESLNDSTLWVGISFVLFVILTFRPLAKKISEGLELKITELKNNLEESRKLNAEAESLYKEQLNKQKENQILIKRIEQETKDEVKKVQMQIKKDIEDNMLRKINNYNLISIQMENMLKEELKEEIIQKVIFYTEMRIKNNLSNKQNKGLITDSIKKIPKNII